VLDENADGKLDDQSLEFLSQLCLGETYCPNHVLHGFELVRLEYNLYGRLK
jgi:hypothetical protein